MLLDVVDYCIHVREYDVCQDRICDVQGYAYKLRMSILSSDDTKLRVPTNNRHREVYLVAVSGIHQVAPFLCVGSAK